MPYTQLLPSSVSQYCPHLIRPRSNTLVVITMTKQCCSHTIRQKSGVVFGNGPVKETLSVKKKFRLKGQ